MLTGKNRIKHKALVLSLIYLFLSGYMMVGEERHGLEHLRHAGHAARHASLICSWLCAASTSIHSANPNINQSLNPFFENLAVSAGPISKRLSVFYFHGRSPPVASS